MARSCGIRIGPRRFELVVLDGSAKNHKITAYKATEFPHFGDDAVAEAGDILKETVRRFNIPRENVGIAIDSGHAAFRSLSLPITDRSKIEQVLKFEVEGQLPQWNIDDVVVDFHILTENESSTELLVTAVPKDDIEYNLAICSRAGIEPLEAECETSAIVNAASAADLCHVDDAQVLVHIGDHSTSVVVMDAGQVREMRVIHIGGLTHEVLPGADDSADKVDGADKAHGADVDEDALSSLEEVEFEELEPAIPRPDPNEAARRVDQAIKRIRRELGRTISGARTLHPIEAIYVCGMELPGLIGSSVLDAPVYVLDCFDEDGGQPADGFGALVAAYGVAYRQLGGGLMMPALRREELRYTGAMERIEFPLAVACLLLCTFLGVVNILQFREKGWLEMRGVMDWLRYSNAYMVGDPRNNIPGNLDPVPQELSDYAKIFEKGEGLDPNRTPLESLEYIRDDLQTRILGLQRDLGQHGDVTQPQSAFMAAILVLGVLEGKEDWRPSLRRLRSTYQPGKRGKPDSVKLTIDVTFFANDTIQASLDYEGFEQALREQPWFVSFEKKSSDPLDDGRGISIRALPITVDVSKYFAMERQSERKEGL